MYFLRSRRFGFMKTVYFGAWKTKRILLGLVLIAFTSICLWKASDLLLSVSNVDLSVYAPNDRLYKQLLAAPVTSLNLASPVINNSSNLIVLVISRPNEENVRRDIRETWANSSFSNGMKTGQISVVFLVGSNVDQLEAVQHEQKTHNDILLVDVEDTYRNLVYKELIAFRWINRYYPKRFVLKIDSDVTVILDEVLRLTHQSDVGAHITCSLFRNSRPFRTVKSPWFVPYSVYSAEYYPDHCSGPFYLISPTALPLLLQAAESSKAFELEDVFFTGMLAKKSGVAVIDNKNMLRSRPWSQVCRDGQSTIISFAFHYLWSPLSVKRAFQEIKNLRCQTWLEIMFHKYSL